ncbi:hypothetical protein G6F40_017739 [Rhizopus arrhizus]|nr:hypothetical protein G6F40_017739 [Rhizopus arrhizus]
MMVHHVMPQLAGRGTQAALPDIGGRVHQQPGRVEGGGVEEDDLGGVLVGLAGLGIDDLHAARTHSILVIEHFLDDRERPQRQIAGLHRRR